MEDTLFEKIRAENLNIYRTSSQRLREDIGQEDEIARNYRGRLLYELIQNADDASAPGAPARLRIELHAEGLWFANSGRALSEDDVRGICGISASTKQAVGEVEGAKRRASIGHKGMGFKSVLEISRAPEIYSCSYAFCFDEARSLGALKAAGFTQQRYAPLMRLPWPMKAPHPRWAELRALGMTTAFFFPFSVEDAHERYTEIKRGLEGLPETTLLFLKQLEAVEIVIGEVSRAWLIVRARRVTHAEVEPWSRVTSMSTRGLYRVRLEAQHADSTVHKTYLVAHDGDIEIGAHRGGLEGMAWADVHITEVSVAARVEADASTPIKDALLHVFLPTAERTPYGFLINGAFASGLSRQHVRVVPETEGQCAPDYNAFLVRAAARLFVEVLFPALLALDAKKALMLLARDRLVQGPLAEVIYQAIRAAIAVYPFVPSEVGALLAPQVIVLPPLRPDIGEALRTVLPVNATHARRAFPAAAWCALDEARVLADHGAAVLSPVEAAQTLAAADPTRSRAVEDLQRMVVVDPILQLLERLWAGYVASEQAASEQAAFVAEVRALPLMPVDVREDRTCHREAVGDRAAFYPPQFLRGEVPLPGLCFLSQAVCWGKLSRQERQETLKAEMVAWQGLFGLQDFKFPEVMRASVLPSMAWDQAPQRARFHDIAQLAAVCQLSGKTGQGERLPFERLGNQRALFALARLEVPCRAPNGGVWWVAAYRAYFGEDWIGDQSVEVLLRACKEAGQPSPDVPFILGPTAFSGYLARYASLDDQAQATDEETLDVDEVGLDEDEDAALPADERERWRTFFSWLGVNAHLRAVHFQDVEDHNTGWLRTEGFIKPRGWIFQALPDAVWDAWRATLIDSLDAKAIKDLHERRRWLYGIHHLEHLDVLLAAAAADAQGGVGRALYQHLQAHWPSLQPVARAVVALTKGHSPGRRKPPRAYTNETVSLCDNLWLWRLKEAAFCPTKHGPRRASQAWRPSRELDRRFKQTGPLLPVLEIDDPSGFAARLGVRAELTPSTFTLDDAEVWLRQLEIVSQNAPDVRAARRLLSTGCRHLMELLVGHQPEVKRAEARLPTLFGEMLVWRPAHQVFFAEQRGAVEGLDVPIFILEGDAHAKKPLQACFGVRLLEAALEQAPAPEAPALLGAELDLFRKAIEACGPALLARLGVERQEERQAISDAHRLAAFLQGVEPVKALMLTTKLDGQLIGAANVPVGVYVDRDHPSHAFVRWSSQAWPPVEEDAERLAEALAVLFGAPRYESFLTLIKARDEAARLRILRRAGASADLEEYQRRLHGDDDLWVEPAPAPKTAGPAPLTSPSPQASPAQALAPTPADTPEAPCHPLWPAASLSVLGCPVRIMSPSAQHTVEGAASVQMREGGTHGYATHRTDLTALDQLGMSVAMSFEQARLARAGGGRVFDVSHPDHIKAASGALRGVFERELRGVSEAWPGFDLLSLDASGRLDRAVELKSSGIAARRQACTWNEWKSAGDPSLRGRYYLYLVGNLRSDLSEQAPFIRTVRDPFGQLHADVQVNTRVERKVYLRVADLQEAEEERLQIIPDAQRSASSAQRP